MVAESKSLSLRGSATKAELDTKTGVTREMAVCDEEQRFYLMNGSTPGGKPVAMLSDLKETTDEDLAEGTSEVFGLFNAKQLAGLGFDPSKKVDVFIGSVKAKVPLIGHPAGFYGVVDNRGVAMGVYYNGTNTAISGTTTFNGAAMFISVGGSGAELVVGSEYGWISKVFRVGVI